LWCRTARKIAFTGSIPTGKAVGAAAHAVAEPLFQSAVANSGRICEATKGVYVPERL